jgi:transcriptional regulator with XRE-family HTH domain/tetratricopeptide (TPR) repeat protein
VDEATARGNQIRGLRRRQQWSQERLAEAAELSVTTIKKAERGGEVSTATLHAIARALGVRTTELYADGAVVPALGAEPNHHMLARLRAAISPPVGLTGAPVIEPPTGPVDVHAIEQNVRRALVNYHADRYDDVADVLPAIIVDAHRAVAELDNDDAYRARARALQMAGRYLTQVRQLPDALAALRASIRDAARVGDRTLAAIAINGQAWALTRQGRLDECERLCTTTADEIEPRLSTASADELATWGDLLFRAAAAAVRNNDADRARTLMQVAAAAAAGLGREHESFATFGPLTVGLKRAEFALIEGQPDQVLQLSERLPDRRDVGDVTPNNWERHWLDVAHAHLQMNDPDTATETLMDVLHRAPEWLRRQNEAHQIVTDICATRPQRLTDQMATLATHLGVAA